MTTITSAKVKLMAEVPGPLYVFTFQGFAHTYRESHSDIMLSSRHVSYSTHPSQIKQQQELFIHDIAAGTAGIGVRWRGISGKDVESPDTSKRSSDSDDDGMFDMKKDEPGPKQTRNKAEY